HAFRKTATIVSAPAFGLLVIIENVVHAECSRGIDVKESSLRTVTRRRPVRGATLIRRDESAVQLRLLRRIWNRLAFRVDTLRPIRLHELGGHEILSIRAVEHKEPAIAARLRQQLSRLAVKLAVEQNRRLHSIPVMRRARRRSEMP